MYSKIQLVKNYIGFYAGAYSGKGHGIHSPFVFEFVNAILNDKRQFPASSKIEKLRRQLLTDKNGIQINDFGAGSSVLQQGRPTVAAIARNSAVTPRLGQLLYRIAAHYRPQIMVELGTSLGLSGAYLASGNPDGALVTLEGAGAVADVAERNFESLGLRNVEIIRGNFDEQLPLLLSNLPVVGLAYIDGNHRKDPVLRYIDLFLPHMAGSSVIILDDIHWSSDMEAAWETIRNDPRILLTVDLFFFGLIFFKDDFKVKQDFNIRFRN